MLSIPHHREIDLGINYSQNPCKYAKIRGQKDLENEIELYNLFITDYSSISFDFIFQNKSVLYYTIDKVIIILMIYYFLEIIFQR